MEQINSKKINKLLLAIITLGTLAIVRDVYFMAMADLFSLILLSVIILFYTFASWVLHHSKFPAIFILLNSLIFIGESWLKYGIYSNAASKSGHMGPIGLAILPILAFLIVIFYWFLDRVLYFTLSYISEKIKKE